MYTPRTIFTLFHILQSTFNFNISYHTTNFRILYSLQIYLQFQYILSYYDLSFYNYQISTYSFIISFIISINFFYYQFVTNGFTIICWRPVRYRRQITYNAQSQFHNEFVSLNDVPILENIPDLIANWNNDTIDLDDVDFSKRNRRDEISPMQEISEREKSIKYLEHLKLISMGRIIDGITKWKAVFKYYQIRLA